MGVMISSLESHVFPFAQSQLKLFKSMKGSYTTCARERKKTFISMNSRTLTTECKPWLSSE
jgi:hypothetical protein